MLLSKQMNKRKKKPLSIHGHMNSIITASIHDMMDNKTQECIRGRMGGRGLSGHINSLLL